MFMLCGDPKKSPRTFINALIILVLRDFLANYYISISFLRHLPDTVLKVTS